MNMLKWWRKWNANVEEKCNVKICFRPSAVAFSNPPYLHSRDRLLIAITFSLLGVKSESFLVNKFHCFCIRSQITGVPRLSIRKAFIFGIMLISKSANSLNAKVRGKSKRNKSWCCKGVFRSPLVCAQLWIRCGTGVMFRRQLGHSFQSSVREFSENVLGGDRDRPVLNIHSPWPRVNYTLAAWAVL